MIHLIPFVFSVYLGTVFCHLRQRKFSLILLMLQLLVIMSLVYGTVREENTLQPRTVVCALQVRSAAACACAPVPRGRVRGTARHK